MEIDDCWAALEDLTLALLIIRRNRASRAEINSAQSEVINDTGVAYDKLGDYDRAVECYTRSLNIELDFAVVLNRGEAYYKAKKFDLARQDFEAIIENSCHADEVLGARYGQALSLMQLGKPSEAIRDLSLNIKEDPGCADSLYCRALAQAMVGGEASIQSALRDCQAALALRPAMESAQRLLLRLSAGRKQPDLRDWLPQAKHHEILEWIRREMVLARVGPLHKESETILRSQVGLTGPEIIELHASSLPTALKQRLCGCGMRSKDADDIQVAIRAAFLRGQTGHVEVTKGDAAAAPQHDDPGERKRKGGSGLSVFPEENPIKKEKRNNVSP